MESSKYFHRVVYGDTCLLQAQGFESVAAAPAIFLGPHFSRNASRYLIDLSLGVWDPVHRGKRQTGRFLTAESLDTSAQRLCNALNWASARSIDLQTCDYRTHLIRGYQQEMLTGIWSAKNRPLSSNTINPRVSEICNFLTWMADKGLRRDFEVPTTTATHRIRHWSTSANMPAKATRVRVGRLPARERKLRMPSATQIWTWLADVERRSGRTMALVCRTVCDTALRRSEIQGFRVDTLPLDRSDWLISNPEAPRSHQTVIIQIRYGAKGPSYGEDNGDKIGPELPIRIPLSLAEALDEYRQRVRPRALRKLVMSGATRQEQERLLQASVHMFLDERTGKRIKGQALYDAWTEASIPFKGWCPHYGRDYWACTALLSEIRRHEALRRADDVSFALLESTGTSAIRFIIQPQLRHAREETCLIYLR